MPQRPTSSIVGQGTRQFVLSVSGIFSTGELSNLRPMTANEKKKKKKVGQAAFSRVAYTCGAWEAREWRVGEVMCVWNAFSKHRPLCSPIIDCENSSIKKKSKRDSVDLCGFSQHDGVKRQRSGVTNDVYNSEETVLDVCLAVESGQVPGERGTWTHPANITMALPLFSVLWDGETLKKYFVALDETRREEYIDACAHTKLYTLMVAEK